MCLFGQMEAVSLPQLDQSLHVALGLCSEAVGVDALLQTETNLKPLEQKTETAADSERKRETVKKTNL